MIVKIKEIEEKDDIKILFLIESGSRAWGWQSQDSDYDIRGVYIQNHNQLKPIKDQISFIDKKLDVVLWDIKKLLILMEKSNPSVWEWLSSNIVYLDNPIRRILKKEFIKNYDSGKLRRHYTNLSKSNYYKYISEKKIVNLRKYLYVIRSIGCINYIDETGNPPPKEYIKLKNYLPKHIFSFMKKIIKNKQIEESAMGYMNYEVNGYILPYFNIDYKEEKSRFKNLKELFDETMKNYLIK